MILLRFINYVFASERHISVNGWLARESKAAFSNQVPLDFVSTAPKVRRETGQRSIVRDLGQRIVASNQTVHTGDFENQVPRKARYF